MGWIFVLLLVVVLVWLVTENKTTRYAAVGLVSVFGLASIVFFYVLDQPERREARTPTTPPAENPAREKRETALKVLKPSDVAFIAPELKPGTRKVWANDGTSKDAPDLFSWTLVGSLKNVSPDFPVNDVTFRVRLFSCPDFFSTPASEATVRELTGSCITIGDRSLAIYGLKIVPGDSKTISEQVTFDSQPEPRNWRYAVEVVRVTAEIN